VKNRPRPTLGQIALLVCGLGLSGLLAAHEFVIEPSSYGNEGQGVSWVAVLEVVVYACIPVLFVVAWLQIRVRLQPLHEIAREIDSWEPEQGLRALRFKADSPEATAVAAALTRASERLRRSFGDIREFSLRAAHEIKTPLTILRGHAEAEARHAESVGDAGLANRLQAQISEIDRLAGLLDSLGLLAKADAGLIPLRLVPGRVDELVSEFHEDVRAMAEPEGLVVKSCFDQPAAAVYDSQRLRQVFLALADNALKHNRRGGEVVLGVFQGGPESGFWIENETLAFVPGEATRVFEPFFRGSRAQTRTEGSGLGLSIARSLVEAQGGRIHFEVLNPGRVRVTVFLPASNVHSDAVFKRTGAGSDSFGGEI
jgi:signal transduction histidine kinase